VTRAATGFRATVTRAVTGFIMWPVSRLNRAGARVAVLNSVLLGAACLGSYWLTAHLVARVYAVSRADDLIGALWAVIATVFVFRDSYERSLAAATSRVAATAVSFVLCLIYLAFLPFYTWGLAMLIGATVLAVTLLGRPDDVITAAITTAVIMIASELSPHHAWQQPILRLADTVVGVAVGLAAAWIDLRLLRPRLVPKP
jgi:uncharacterized membrane protein YccC